MLRDTFVRCRVFRLAGSRCRRLLVVESCLLSGVLPERSYLFARWCCCRCVVGCPCRFRCRLSGRSAGAASNHAATSDAARIVLRDGDAAAGRYNKDVQTVRQNRGGTRSDITFSPAALRPEWNGSDREGIIVKNPAAWEFFNPLITADCFEVESVD